MSPRVMSSPATGTAAADVDLVADLESALAHLRALGLSPVEDDAVSLTDALDTCQKQLAALTSAMDIAPQRCLHHFACSGGTVISKAVAALPNVQLLSEIDPLSTLSRESGRNPFHPSDLIADLHFDPRRPDVIGAAADVFLAGLDVLRRTERREGRYLVLRDHAHSQFCSVADPASRPTLRKFLQEHMPVLSVLTVRHPLDSFLSLQGNKWVHFTPPTIEEYCRRLLLFLDAYEGVPVYRYEDFVEDPQDVITRIAADLRLPFDAGFPDLLSLFALSGDSGRKGSTIAQRPRRPVPEAIALEAADSATYKDLCRRLCYAPDETL